MQERNYTIDIVRGFAIFTMIASNLAGELLIQPHPLYLTIIGSMAAPIFIFLAGYLVAMGVTVKDYKFSYFLIRGFLTILVGAAIDSFLWGMYPFTTVDVLYLTGTSIIICYFFVKLPNLVQLALTIFIFIIGFYFRQKFGYIETPTMIPFLVENKFQTPIFPWLKIFKHWMIDGWFPIFSWLGIAFLGSQFYLWKATRKIMKNMDYIQIILFSLVITLLGNFLIGQEARYVVRNDYTELFYPPTYSYYLIFSAFIFIFFMLIEYRSTFKIYVPFKMIGESPLFFYFLHFFLISKIAIPYWGKDKSHTLSLQNYFLTYISILIFCLVIAVLIRQLKSKWKNQPFIVRFFIGS